MDGNLQINDRGFTKQKMVGVSKTSRLECLISRVLHCIEHLGVLLREVFIEGEFLARSARLEASFCIASSLVKNLLVFLEKSG
jgi:hypothetical protein